MTYDLKVILKYCGRSSHDLLVLCGWSWPLSGPLLAVLCRSWGLCWRSWAALGTFVGGPGPSWTQKLPWPEREGDLTSGRKVAQTRAGAGSAKGRAP